MLKNAVVKATHKWKSNGNIKEWDCLTKIQKLDLSMCGLEKLPDSIGQLTNLQTLWLDFNNLQQLPASMGGLTNLTTLNISNNKLSKFPQFIRQLHKLERLDIYGNKMAVEPEWVLGLKALKRLWMSKYQLRSEQQIQQVEKECKKRGITLVWWK